MGHHGSRKRYLVSHLRMQKTGVVLGWLMVVDQEEEASVFVATHPSSRKFICSGTSLFPCVLLGIAYAI